MGEQTLRGQVRTIELRLTSTDTASHRGRRGGPAKTVQLPTYEVLLDGEVVGTVARYMATRETGPQGRTYVSDRWTSPGWRATYPGLGSGRLYATPYETRTRAVEAVLAAKLDEPVYVVSDLAKAATVQR